MTETLKRYDTQGDDCRRWGVNCLNCMIEAENGDYVLYFNARSEIEKRNKVITDMSETDTNVRNILRPIMDVDGDSHGVPGLEDLAEEMVKQLAEANRSLARQQYDDLQLLGERDKRIMELERRCRFDSKESTEMEKLVPLDMSDAVELAGRQQQEITRLREEIALWNPCGHTGVESFVCDICGYPDPRKLITVLRQEIANRKANNEIYRNINKALKESVQAQADKLSRLTALIESKEEMEK